MALDAEIIKANPALKDLSEEAVSAIETLSKNDEERVITTKIGEYHGMLEKDVKEATGIDKSDGEKSYEYTKRVLKELKEKSTGSSELQTQIDGYKTKVADLEKKIREGNTDEAVKQQLKDTETRLAALQEKYDEDKLGWTEKEKGFNTQLRDNVVNGHFSAALSKLKFQDQYPEGVQKTLVDSAKASILGQYTPDFVAVNGSDQKELIFRDKDGNPVYNKADSLKPHTAESLLREQLKDVLSGENKGGTGGKGGSGSKETVVITDIASAKTQVQADEIIVKHLMQNGVARGTEEFATKQKELREEHKIDKLPIQ